MFKYLFEAQFKDGSILVQTQDDVSTTSSDRNAFYDVLQRANELEKFALGAIDNTAYYLVDLKDGHFEINGASVRLHEDNEPLSNFRLIFFKRHRHNFNLDMVEESHQITYRLGWQANLPGGRNVQRVLEIE